MTDAAILCDINAQLPPGVDWTNGAIEYLESVKRNGFSVDEALSKPFWKLRPDSGQHAYEEVADLFGNFIDVFKLINLPAGSRILDVACGAGWLSLFWTRLGYKAFGFDICPDFIELARHRLRTESSGPIAADIMFQTHDIEAGPLTLPEPIDLAIFESCFHHFYNPIEALRNVNAMLAENGVAVLIEGGSRVTAEFRDVMARYRTIERPYTRSQLKQILRAAGMNYFAFFAPCNRWIAQGYSSEREMSASIESAFTSQNRCVCARTEAAIRRVVPDWVRESSLEMASGFWGNSGTSTWWCSPHARARVNEDCSINVRVCPATTNQTVSIYSSNRGKLKSVQLSEPQLVTLRDLDAGDTLHLCSDHAFSPSWSGENDPRILSFWVEVTTVAD